jgi:two-component system response regulator YesN
MKRILVVDDDISTTESISSYLIENGYEVIIASNGSEGLELVKKFNPDLLITDIRMPKLNGLELYSVLRDMNFNKPIIFISSYDYRESTSNNLKIMAYIEKPINIFELDKYIKLALHPDETNAISYN